MTPRLHLEQAAPVHPGSLAPAPAGVGEAALKRASPRIRLSSIEALRGLAAAAVVAYHGARHLDKAFGLPWLAALFGPGQVGVDLFFTLSGFIILHVHRRDIARPARLTHYLGRRFTRVLPLYWIALAITIGLGTAASHILPGAGRLFFSALLLPSHQEPLLGVAWTLQFEMLFYAVFALLILNRVLGAAVFAAWLVCIACQACGLSLAVLPPQVTGIYGLEFFAGMASAQLLDSGRTDRSGIVAAAGLGLLIAALAVTSQAPGASGVTARLLYCLPASMIIFGLASMDQAGRDGVPGWATRIGSASYSIYLFQFVFIGIVWQSVKHGGLDHRLPPPVLFVLLTIAAVAGGVLTSEWVEKPMLRRLRG